MHQLDDPPASAMTLITFRGVSRPVALDDEDTLLPIFRSVFRYWPHRVVADGTPDAPVITVRPSEKGGYRLEAPWLDKPARYTNAVNLACGLGVHVNQAFLAGPEDRLCLHSAAARIGGRLVVFPNAYRAGKSLLTVCLAAAGARIFCDDILPVAHDSGLGFALGITPRLRLPLPTNLSRRTGDFIDARRGAENRQYLYVDLEADEQAPFGETAPLGGIVLLDRREGESARLERVGVGEALKYVVLRNFARKVPVEESLDRLHRILMSAYCARLTYSSGDEAADLLVRTLADWDSVAPRDAARPEAGPIRAPNGASRRAGGRLRRRAGIRERIADGDLFLVDSSEQAIYHLNAVGTGLWRLLDGACDTESAIAILCEAFPEAGRERIARDVKRLVSDLVANGLLVDGGANPE